MDGDLEIFRGCGVGGRYVEVTVWFKVCWDTGGPRLENLIGCKERNVQNC